MDIYAQNIMDHFKHPRNRGRLSSPSATRHEANHSCGDILDVDLAIRNGKIEEVKFEGQGCAISQSAMSIVSEALIGKKVDDAIALSEKDVHKLLGVDITARRRKCALLSLLTVKNALLEFQKKEPLAWSDLVDE